MASTTATTAPKAPRLQRLRKPRTPAPTTCRLLLVIGATTYTVRPITSAFHSRAWRLRKPDGTAYHVTQDEAGQHCECGDQVWRHEGTPGACKHIRAMRADRLLDVTPTAPPPATLGCGRPRDEFDTP